MPFRLVLFGPPELRADDATSALPFERRSQLLVWLALKRSWVSRAEAATLLWRDQDASLAHANLRKTLFRLRSLPWGHAVEQQSTSLRVTAHTDVAAFEQALREGRIDAALALRRGELLPGFDDDANEAWTSWLAFERDRLRVAWRGAAQQRLAGGLDPADCIVLSARLLEADPLDETALRAHMACLARAGQSGRARQAYRAFSARLADELGLQPSAELRAAHDALGATTPATAPAATTGPPDEGFVGRNVELQRIGELLQRDDCALLSVVGPGGAGKTRLARQAMRRFAARFADGAVFVPLEDVSAPGEIGRRLALELGLGPEGAADPLEQAIAALRERHQLLVLDNFEHLTAGASLLPRLLQACPRLKLMVTSRVRLALPQEQLLPLEGLPCPGAEDHDRIEAFDATRLFVQAALRVEPALVPAVEAAAIVDICRQVEGLPLALEMAAAWTRLLPCAAIAAELRDGGEMLRARDPARPPRHASIEIVFEQSWQLLTPTEREVLARLSVCHGGFTAEAARAVANASLPVLAALVDKSLLRKDGARSFLHPLLQPLAAARLGDGAQRAHAVYFLGLLAQLRAAVRTSDRHAMRQIDIEFENCRAAWRWASAHGETGLLSAAAVTLAMHAERSGRFEEGLLLLREAAQASATQRDGRLQTLLAGETAHLLYHLDRYAEAEATAARTLQRAHRTHDHETRLQCLKVLAGCALRLGRLAEARRRYEQALRQSPAATDPRNAAGVLDNLALIEKRSGRYDESLRMSMAALAQYRRVADPGGEALCLNNLGALLMDRGEHALALAHLNDALAICERHGLGNTRGFVLANLAALAHETGDLAAALGHVQRALEVARANKKPAIEAYLKLQLASIALRQGDAAAARAELRAALEIALAIGQPPMQLACVTVFAEILAQHDALDCAHLLMAFAAGHAATSAHDRDDIRKRTAGWPAPAQPIAPRASLDLAELAHRIVVETAVAHAPLIAALRAPV